MSSQGNSSNEGGHTGAGQSSQHESQESGGEQGSASTSSKGINPVQHSK